MRVLRGRHRRRRRGRGGCRGLRGDRQLRRRDARRPLDPRARPSSSRRTSSARTCCSTHARDAGVRLVQVSTDEVYGDVRGERARARTTRCGPSSPYSASKAGGDLQVARRTCARTASTRRSRAARTPTGRTSTPRSSIPLFITNALDGEPLPVYGDGRQRREWLHVEDHCAGDRARAARRARPARSTTSAATSARTSSWSRRILDADRRRRVARPPRRGPPRPRPPLLARRRRSCSALGWAPQRAFEEGLAETVEWYRENRAWWEPIKSGEYRAYYRRQYAERLLGAERRLLADFSAPVDLLAASLERLRALQERHRLVAASELDQRVAEVVDRVRLVEVTGPSPSSLSSACWRSGSAVRVIGPGRMSAESRGR